MITVNISKSKETWVSHPDYKDLKFNIIPLTNTVLERQPGNTSLPTQEDYLKYFTYCVRDWSGIVDENKKEIKCDDEAKKIVFEYNFDISIFVINESFDLRNKIITIEEQENLKKSDSSEETKQ